MTRLGGGPLDPAQPITPPIEKARSAVALIRREGLATCVPECSPRHAGGGRRQPPLAFLLPVPPRICDPARVAREAPRTDRMARAEAEEVEQTSEKADEPGRAELDTPAPRAYAEQGQSFGAVAPISTARS
jgi:hypothetical protein